jgi:hypothetical protein
MGGIVVEVVVVVVRDNNMNLALIFQNTIELTPNVKVCLGVLPKMLKHMRQHDLINRAVFKWESTL